ncbi:MAG: GFA family protein [Sphingomonadaceae bacterium]
METERTYEGSCFCGTVQIAVTGAPVAMGYCHCESCRMWSAAPVNAFTLWKPDTVRVTKGENDIAVYHKTPRSHRHYCKMCGGHLFTEHPHWSLTDVYAGIIPTFPFKASVHVNCQEAVLPLQDGLPKFKDVPKEMGGTGETIAEIN